MSLELTNIYIERCDKETEEVLAKETEAFLNTPIHYFKKQLNEFLYIESPVFDEIKVDAFSIEVDDVFRTYMVLFGFNIQKKYAGTIKKYLEENLHTDSTKNYSALFAGNEGLWEINVPIDFIDGFHEEMTIEEVLSLTYNFINGLITAIEKSE